MTEKIGRSKVCVITPYYKESRAWLERCVASVQLQTVRADHVLIADGHPQPWLDSAHLRHIKLDRAHADYGNVARGLAALMAVSENYEAIAFLDADNWYADDHLETCLTAAEAQPAAPYVIARRFFVRLDESVMPLASGEDVPLGDHVDTNCYLFLPPAFALLHYWVTIPQEFSAVGDRLFRLLLKSRLSTPVVASKPTVFYTCLFESIYRGLGEAFPPGAKPGVDWRPGIEWLRRLPAERRGLVDQLAGLALSKLVLDAA
jgi:hypothetical protein